MKDSTQPQFVKKIKWPDDILNQIVISDCLVAMRQIPDEVVHGLYQIGHPDSIKAGLQRYFDNGADTVIVASLETVCDPREAARAVAPGAR